MTTVFVSGAVANKHRQGGSIWVRMSWAEALRDAGHDVVFAEQIDARDCVDANGAPALFEDSANAAAFATAMQQFGFAGALICPDGRAGERARVLGMQRDELFARAADAELLVNIGGHLRWEPLLRRLRTRAFVDLDPGFTQIWHAEGRDIGVAAHDVHFTVGMNVGTASCPLPSGGVCWRAIRQPVTLARWNLAGAADDTLARFTTVASWRGAYGPARWAGRSYGVKAHEFRRFLAVSEAVRDARFEVALDIHPGDSADVERLQAHGWALSDPAALAATADFRRFVQASGAEFSPAQNIYVDTNSGWFSDRTVRYLASGRPALVQDTGFSAHLPTGAGLIAFTTLGEAVAGARELLADYPRHRAAARRIAAEHFAGPRAIAPLLHATGLQP